MRPTHPGKPLFIINVDLTGAGFGACILATINQLRFCERKGYLPIVSYDQNSDNAFFDPEYGNSMWEQYFEPVVPGWPAVEVQRCLNDPEHSLSEGDLIQITDVEIWREIQSADSVASFTYAEWRNEPPEDLQAWYSLQRARARETVNKFVQPNQKLQNKFDAFWSKNNTSGFVLGVHMRGTDLHYAPPVSPAEYFPVIEKWIEREPDLKIFLATDQHQYFELMRDRYGSRLIAYDASRSENEVAPFTMDSISPYKRGEDVLLDILFLSRCNHLLKGASNVGEMAMYFGPSLTCSDLSLGKDKAFGQDYGSGWEFHASRPAWALLKGSDLTQIEKNASSQSRMEWIRSQAHRAYVYLVVFPVRITKRYGNALMRRLAGRGVESGK